MIVNYNGKKEEKIEVGDVIVSSADVVCLIAKLDNDDRFPIVAIDLSNGKIINGWKTLGDLNQSKTLLYADNIVDIIKGDRVELNIN